MQYMVRIEMHREDSAAYARLHFAETAEGFSRTLTDEKSRLERKMATGVCWMETSNDASFVLEAAKRAVLPIDPDAMIIVAGGPQIVYYNFAKAPVLRPLVASSTTPHLLGRIAALPAFSTTRAQEQVPAIPGLYSALLESPRKR